MTMDLYTAVLPNQKQDEMKKFEYVLDSVFESGDSIAEERYNKEILQQNKIVDLKRLG